MTTVTLSLVSHTNVGKTTLARTLLRRDVGEVLDHAHVTEVNEAYPLIETADARLQLWDTPGFGDSARLIRRLEREKSPIGWFLHQVWDRTRDRPLWCSQEALRNIKNDADVVLYLVNASEDPEDAGYVRHELRILAWVGKPVLVLLNQTGVDASAAAGLEAGWREFTEPWECVRRVITLDAFSRIWIQESVLFDTVAEALTGEQQQAMHTLTAAWNARNQDVFDTCLTRMGAHLARAATDRESLESASPGKLDKQRAMAALADRLVGSERELWDSVIAAHGLEGRAAAELRDKLEDFAVKGERAMGPGKGAIIGGALSGALSGLVADVMVGGLSFGGGLVAGTILGALGGAGLTQGIQLVRSAEEPAVSWSAGFLDELVVRSVLRYLAIAHFGRGRGEFQDVERPAHWRAAVERAFQGRKDGLAVRWSIGEAGGAERRDELAHDLRADLHALTADVLEAAYPGSVGLLGLIGPLARD